MSESTKPTENTAESGNKSKPLLCDVFKGKTAILKEDFYTDDYSSCDVLIKKGTKVFIKGNESDGTCYVEYNGFGFSIKFNLLNIT